MTSRKPSEGAIVAPERLLHSEGPERLLLEQASEEWQEGLNERRAWERLSRRLDAPFNPREWWPFGLALAGAAAVLVLWVVPWLRNARPDIALTPEHLRARNAAHAPSAKPPEEPPLLAREAARAPREEPKRSPAPSAAKSEASAAPAIEAPAAASGAALDCAALARTGNKAEARACWSQQALGSGLSAELALYEISRLDVQAGDYSQAVSHLREHQRRFPGGQLQGEVAVTLVEALSKSGDAAQALTESERLLGTPSGRERAEQLHWLRGNLYRGQRDYVHAQSEYEQIGPSSKFGAEALYYIAVCLEARGQRDAARQAYQEYLAHPNATRADAVKRKLEQL